VNQADSFCLQNHRFTYDEKLKVESVTQSVCDLALRFGEGAEGEESIMVREKNKKMANKNEKLIIHLESSFWCCTAYCWC
jgi:hypothetical protein